MAVTTPRSETTLAVILGASKFPLATSLTAKQSFLQSAEGFRDYMLSRDGFELVQGNLLWLFDNDSSADDIDAGLTGWLKNRVSEMEAKGTPVQDLILYYVGHGCFAKNGSDYGLAVRQTRGEKPYHSSYRIASLADTLKTHSGGLRKYLILDCCFAAAVYKEFQSTGPLEAVRQKTTEVFQEAAMSVRSGTALLCASGPRDPARAPDDLPRTMFSSALLDVLKTGSRDLGDRLTFNEIGEMTQARIAELHADEGVRPQTLVPEQTKGNVAAVALFPNPARRGPDLVKEIEHLKAAIADLHAAAQGLVDVSAKVAVLESTSRDISQRLAVAEARSTTTDGPRSDPGSPLDQGPPSFPSQLGPKPIRLLSKTYQLLLVLIGAYCWLAIILTPIYVALDIREYHPLSTFSILFRFMTYCCIAAVGVMILAQSSYASMPYLEPDYMRHLNPLFRLMFRFVGKAKNNFGAPVGYLFPELGVAGFVWRLTFWFLLATAIACELFSFNVLKVIQDFPSGPMPYRVKELVFPISTGSNGHPAVTTSTGKNLE